MRAKASSLATEAVEVKKGAAGGAMEQTLLTVKSFLVAARGSDATLV